MSIYFDSIHLPPFFSGSLSSFAGELNSRVVRAIQGLSYCIRYNELTLLAATTLFNLGSITVSEIIMRRMPERLRFENLKNDRVRDFSILLFKSAVAGAGLSGLNYLLQLQLTPILIAASAVSTVALQLLWQKVISPELNRYRVKNETDAKDRISEVNRQESPSPAEEGTGVSGTAQNEASNRMDDDVEQELDDCLPDGSEPESKDEGVDAKGIPDRQTEDLLEEPVGKKPAVAVVESGDSALNSINLQSLDLIKRNSVLGVFK